MLINLIETFIYCSLLMLSFLMIANPLRVNQKANFWFGMFLISWSSFWFDEVIFLVSDKVFGNNLRDSIRLIQFFNPIFFFFSVQYFTNTQFKLSLSWYKYVIIPFFYFILLITNNIFDFLNYFILLGIFLVHTIVYLILTFFLIKKHKSRIQLFSSDTYEINLDWLEKINISLIVLFITVIGFNIISNFGEPLNLYANIIVLTIVYFTAYHSLRQREIFPSNRKNESLMDLEDITTDLENKRKLISDDKLIELKTSLSEIMKTKKLYLNNNINLITLSEEMAITSHQLSYVINRGFNENFFQFINKYRVEFAKKLLLNEDSNKITIEGVGYESGFSSKTSFYTTFKKITGNTPSEFKKLSSNL